MLIRRAADRQPTGQSTTAFGTVEKHDFRAAFRGRLTMAVLQQASPPFTRNALAVLFERSNFEAFQQPGAPSHYWAPLISACSGARRDEIFFLTPDDIRPFDGTYFFLIKATSPGPGRPGIAARSIPLHPLLVRLGLPEWVETRRQAQPQERVFSEYKALREHAGLPFSRAFVQWIKATAERLPPEQRHLFAEDFHFPSLRALFLAEAGRAGMDDAVARAIRGTEGGTPPADREASWRALAAAELARVDIESCFPPLDPYRELLA
ncbi:hypothetical protein [Desulfobulbus sp.]|uniref:hypothetical protein n=1 Tax=Desulfobulbus sp. TaxID=895 RepID=UPI00286ED368|nr:hypothetical protein [Desulfobulbus sp.]